MNVLKLGAAVVFGLLLGAVLSHTPTVKASAQTLGFVHVSIKPVTVPDAKSEIFANFMGVKVVGISSIPKPQQNMPDSAVCYVATTSANPY
jgi:hypothetical protein